MGCKTHYEEAQYLESLRSQTLYVGLCTAITNGEAGSVSEVAASEYARQSLTFSSPTSNSSGSSMSNDAVIEFPVALGNWGLVTSIIITDALSGGNKKHYGTLGSSKNIGVGDTFRFPIGSIVLTDD